jgi:hypothetical protein
LQFRHAFLYFPEQSEERLHGIEKEIGNIGTLIQEHQLIQDTKFEQIFQMLRSLQTEQEGFGGIGNL